MRMIVRQFVFLVIFSCTSHGVQAGDATDCLKITTFTENVFDMRISTKIVSVLAKGGICIEIITTPTMRSTQQLLLGFSDGELFRHSGYLEVVKTVALRVPTPLFGVEYYLVSADPSIRQPSDLQDFDLIYIIIMVTTTNFGLTLSSSFCKKTMSSSSTLVFIEFVK